MDRITIIGTGLVGTSLGLAIKKAKLRDVELVGVDKEKSHANKAKKMGALDRVEDNLRQAVAGANIVVIATPVMAIKDVMEAIGPSLNQGCLVTDTGSTKCAVLQWSAQYLPNTLDFVGGHPMAGKETAGPEGADASLFTGRAYCIVPRPGSSAKGVETLVGLATTIGARPYFIDAPEHDSFVAAVSHLPFILSAALIGATSKSPQWDDIAFLAATGFKDVTRLASGDVTMHRDICLTNREGLLYWLDEFIGELHRMKAAIQKEDNKEELQALFNKAYEEREKWQAGLLTPWRRGEVERPKTPSFSQVTGEMLVGEKAMKRFFGDDKKDNKGKKK